MTYQVLARKWRPKNFAEMVGQEHVLRALINALDTNRLHHAFLFTGTRGVGKTTIARILAKSLNCEQGVSSKPCGVCSACREIDEGRFVDLIEVDAASRTKVEDTRELLDNVQYAPTRGRYKVYLIDEVHMLSGHSFNALLKTLEEPPPHVKFLLATTDPQKLPITILSRCLQFNLRRIAPERIQGHLAHLLEAEQISSDTIALTQLARAADGSMRDALSLLDQAIAFGGGKVTAEEVSDMLGSIEQTHVYDVLDALTSADAAKVLASLKLLAEKSPDFSEVLAEIVSALQRIALLQQVPDAYDETMGEHGRLTQLVTAMSKEDVQLYYQIGLLGRRDLSYSPDPRAGLEMVLLRMLAFRPGGGTGEQVQSAPDSTAKMAAVPVSQASPTPVKTPSVGAIASEQNEPVIDMPTSPSAPVADVTSANWAEMVKSMRLTALMNELAMHSTLTAREGDGMELSLPPEYQYLLTRERELRLQEAISGYLGKVIRLKISVKIPAGETPADRQARLLGEKQSAAQSAVDNDVNIKKMMEMFNAQVVPDSIQPISD